MDYDLLDFRMFWTETFSYSGNVKQIKFIKQSSFLRLKKDRVQEVVNKQQKRRREHI